MASEFEAPQWKLWLRTFFFPPDREFDSEFIDITVVVVVFSVSVDSDAPADPLLKFFRMKFWSRILYRLHEIKRDFA